MKNKVTQPAHARHTDEQLFVVRIAFLFMTIYILICILLDTFL